MNFDINQLLRPNIKAMSAYSSARSDFKGSADVFLDANENPFDSGLNRYPDPLQNKVKQEISKLKGIAAENIFLGNGSDEPIDLILRAVCRPGIDKALTFSPTYGMYEVSCNLNDIELIKVPLNAEFDLPAIDMNAAEFSSVKVVFICTPNNPSGNSLNQDIILDIIKSFNGLVVIDEAYIDFSTQGSLIGILDKFPNVIILQTFSKAWGLAGIRAGMAFSNKAIIDVLNKIKPPYNISVLNQQALLDSLNSLDQVNRWIKEIKLEREKVKIALESIPAVIKVYPSDANFVLFRINNANEVYKALVAKGVIVRNRSNIEQCSDCLRVSIGTSIENNEFIQALIEITK